MLCIPRTCHLSRHAWGRQGFQREGVSWAGGVVVNPGLLLQAPSRCCLLARVEEGSSVLCSSGCLAPGPSSRGHGTAVSVPPRARLPEGPG